MIKAIIFDCFGVLASDGWLPFKRRYFGTNPELFERAGELNNQVNAGIADYGDFLREMGQMANISEAEARMQIDNNPPNTELFAYIESTLKPHYKIGLLSNAGANWLPNLFSAEQIALFDAIDLSYETGKIKPEAEAFQHIAHKLGLDTTECVFVDDQERYCAAARDEGMQTVHFTSFDEFRVDLEQLLAK